VFSEQAADLDTADRGYALANAKAQIMIRDIASICIRMLEDIKRFGSRGCARWEEEMRGLSARSITNPRGDDRIAHFGFAAWPSDSRTTNSRSSSSPASEIAQKRRSGFDHVRMWNPLQSDARGAPVVEPR